MRLQKELQLMIEDINRDYNLELYWDGYVIRDRKIKGIITPFDNNKELYNYLCGMRLSFWLVKNKLVKVGI